MFVVIHNPPRGNARILGPFVSDEAAVAWILARPLKQQGYYVWAAVEKPG